jgi:peroxiredoxin
LVVWGVGVDINQGDTLESVTDFRDQMGVTYTVLYDENGVVYEDYNQQAEFGGTIFPQQWLIGADGTVIYVNNAYEPDALIATIEEALEAAGL